MPRPLTCPRELATQDAALHDVPHGLDLWPHTTPPPMDGPTTSAYAEAEPDTEVRRGPLWLRIVSGLDALLADEAAPADDHPGLVLVGHTPEFPA